MTTDPKKTCRDPATPLTQSPSRDLDSSIPAKSPGAEKAKFALDPVLCDVTIELERLVPLDTWVHENARNRSIWNHGSPQLTEPDGMGKWLKLHEARLAKRGAVIRLGKAWRIVEPTFKPVLFEILTEERDRAGQRKGGVN